MSKDPKNLTVSDVNGTSSHLAINDITRSRPMTGRDGKSVLLVEDNPANLELATVLLEVAGFRVLTAATAADALVRARADLPDLVLMDISLPDMDGLTATRWLKADPVTAAIPVVALTAQAMPDGREKAVAAGCVGYITKPIDTRQFAQTVNGFMARKKTT